jgi:hypothetical protein
MAAASKRGEEGRRERKAGEGGEEVREDFNAN